MVKDLLRRSSKAVCAASERELIVHHKLASSTKARLKKAGYRIIGTSEREGNSVRIWFIARGGIPLF